MLLDMGAVCHQFSLLSTDLHLIPSLGLTRRSTRVSAGVLPQLSLYGIGQLQTGNVSAAYAYLLIMF